MQFKILKEEFPYLSFDTDSDIELYFEFRKMGKLKEALLLYNTKLRRKFPDDDMRAELLRCYRSHDPGFKQLLYECIVVLAEKVENRIFYIISVLTENVRSVKISDAYSVIRFAESLLSIISPDRMKAVGFTEKYARYATLLDFKAKEMNRTAELIRMYITDTVESIQDLKREREARYQIEQKKKKEALFVDFSKIHFSAHDVARILIPHNISRTEDSVIAYCLKYWNQVFDPAFERIIVLYSKKYRTKHSEIFFAIKNGREHGWKDEEILNAVLSSVVTGYYYNISGDLYLQRTWRYYKAGLEAAASENQTEKEPSPSAGQSVRHEKENISRLKPEKSHGEKGVEKSSGEGMDAGKVAGPDERPEEKKAGGEKNSKETSKKSVRNMKNSHKEKSFVPNSVADIIKKLSGKTYTVYKEIFFQEVRSSIREELSVCAGKKIPGIFSSHQNAAEDIVFNYLMSHYDDPYQNWMTSQDKKKVDSLGFNLKTIEPIVSRWIKGKSI